MAAKKQKKNSAHEINTKPKLMKPLVEPTEIQIESKNIIKTKTTLKL